MIVKMEKRFCDVCGAEIQKSDLSGSFMLKAAGRDYAGNGFPIEIVRQDVCNCCIKKLEDIVYDFLEREEGKGKSC